MQTWMEYPNAGGSNYHSAMGAYLQSLLYGYGGLRIHMEYLYMNPRLPQGLDKMAFQDISKFSYLYYVCFWCTMCFLIEAAH